MSVTDGSRATVGSRIDGSEILAGKGTIFWQPGSAETWLKSGSSWEEQRVQGSRETRFKTRSFKEFNHNTVMAHLSNTMELGALLLVYP